MNRKEFEKLLPTDNEKREAANREQKNTFNKDFDILSFITGARWLSEFLMAKLSDFTEDEMKAIEYFKINKLGAVVFLKGKTGWGIKETLEFLEQNQ